MRVIIAGDREFNNEDLMWAVMESFWMENPIETVVSGCARGADRMGEKWARERGLDVARFPADWDQHGKAAGPIRNREMADNADALVAFLAPWSKGTKDMVKAALDHPGIFLIQVVKIGPEDVSRVPDGG